MNEQAEWVDWGRGEGQVFGKGEKAGIGCHTGLSSIGIIAEMLISQAGWMPAK
jgi:hypothetical protein